jgi:hypothetical protein
MDKIKLLTPDSGVDLKVCSSQVQELYQLDSEYQLQVLNLWAATSDNPGPRELRKRGYRYLISLYYEMPKRAEVDGKPMSNEFSDLVYFCRYVGPRPTPKHSLHRQDNDIGYRVGNVEWADKRKQSEIRRNTQHHVYLDRRLTDRALAEMLSAKGSKVSVAAIKKQRQRLGKKGYDKAEVTRLIFKQNGLPYATSSDPLEAWDFPDSFREQLTKLYPHFRRTSEIRIAYFVRWLEEQVLAFRKLIANPHTSNDQATLLNKVVSQYQATISSVRAELKVLHQKNVQIVLANVGALHASPPATLTSPLKLPTTEPCLLPIPEKESKQEIQPNDPEPMDTQFLIDRDFWSGLPRLPGRHSNEQREEWKRVFKTRKEEFAKQGKFPTCA